MSSQPLPIDESVITTLKVRRDELIKEATAVRVDVVFLFANGQGEQKVLEEQTDIAIKNCPKREKGKVEDFDRRIQELEESIEYSSFSLKEEREVGEVCLMGVNWIGATQNPGVEEAA